MKETVAFALGIIFILAFYSSLTDISESNKKQLECEKLQTKYKQFGRNYSHEFRQKTEKEIEECFNSLE